MKITQQLVYAFGIAVLFLLTHILMASFKLGDALDLIFSLSLMFAAQLLAFLILKRHDQSIQPAFKTIWGLLCFTQFFSISLLTLNSAFNPFIKNDPIQYEEVLISLIIFGIFLPLIFATVFWFLQKRKISK
jgi:hypothetical protein